MNPQLEKLKVRGRLYRWGGFGDGGDSDGGGSDGGDGGDGGSDSGGGLGKGFNSGGYGLSTGNTGIGINGDKVGFTGSAGSSIGMGNQNRVGTSGGGITGNMGNGNVASGITGGGDFGGYGFRGNNDSGGVSRAEGPTFANKAADATIKAFVNYLVRNALMGVNPAIGLVARYATKKAMDGFSTYGNDPSASTPSVGFNSGGGGGGGNQFSPSPVATARAPASGSVAAALQRVASAQRQAPTASQSMQTTLADGLTRLANRPRQQPINQWF